MNRFVPRPKQLFFTIIIVSTLVILVILINTFLGNTLQQLLAEQVKTVSLLNFDRKTFPNLPDFYTGNIKKPSEFNGTCARFPKVFDVEYNNYFWQTLYTTNGTFQLLNAYFDDRFDGRSKMGSVKIMGMLNRVDPAVETYCQMWYEDKKAPLIIKVSNSRKK